MSKYKTVSEKATAQDAFEGALSELTTLHEELEDWHSNMSGTNLENTEKFSQVEEAMNGLSSLPDDFKIPEELQSVEVTSDQMVCRSKKQRASRAVRCSNAIAWMAEVKALLEEREQDYDELERLLDELEYLEFPGMY